MAFSVSVIINAVDVSLKIKGLVTVKGSEGEARIARFAINPDAGVIDPYSYIGQSVTINFIDGASARLFTGIVHQPSYDITTGLLLFVCTDNLQEAVELIDRPAVDFLLPGYWDKAVFSDPSENWSYAQQIMSTYPGSFNKDANGAIVVTDWQPKATPDFTFTDSTIAHNSLTISALAERRNITNSVKITFQNRYQRLWQRELSGTWSLGIVFGSIWFNNPTDLPTKVMVEQAASGWTKKSISFTDLPPTGWIDGHHWTLSDYGKTQCLGASIAVAKRWNQNVTDTYTITIKSAASITQHGLLEVKQNHSLTADDNSSFAEFKDYKAPTGTLVEAGNYVELTAASPSNAILTAVNVAKTKILASHRNNRITFKAALDASIDTDKTVRINHTKAQATGKVASVTHEIDLTVGSARAITTCTIAVYSPNIAAQTDDAITVPASPYVDPAGLDGTLPALNSYFGNVDQAPVEDPDWNGFIANHEEWTGIPPAPQFYDQRFSFEIPAITDTAAVDFAGSSSFNVAIPQNELVVIK